MDRFDVVMRMPLRRLVGLVFFALACTAGLILAVSGWVLVPAPPGGGSPVIHGGGTILAVLFAIALCWFGLDELLQAREMDRKSLPARPEFYDFGLLNQPMHLSEFGGRPLKSLTYVVFDTETTGLKPSAGDEIVSIAGVRVVDGEIRIGEAFTRLVNPGRPIPKRSIRFHGITDDMVHDEPLAREVLPQFHAFIDDAVLVAHNAAFDMRFLKLKEAESGVVFDQLVLDSLLLSVFLDHDSHNHSLDAIAERLGIEVEGRHTALGDSLVTAGIFLRMVQMLEARGVRTLRQAIDASNQVAHVRKMQEQF